MNNFENLDTSNAPAIRKRLRVQATTTDDELERQLSERLLEAWHFTEKRASFRELMLLLLLELEVITDTDLMKGGRDGAALRNRAMCCHANQLLKTGQARNKREAAEILFKAPDQKLELGTIIKLLSVTKSDAAWNEKSLEPRSIRRRNDHTRVVRALETAAAKLEKDYELMGLAS